MAQKYTPGPWAYQASAGDHDFLVYAEADGRADLALVRNFDEANARLIAAAPDLAASLSELLEELDGLIAPDADMQPALQRAHALLVRIQGEG